VSSPADLSGRARTLEELRRVIRRIENVRATRPASEPIEKLVGGDVVDTGAGPLVVVRREFPLSHRHGRLALGDALAVAAPALELLAPLGAPSDPRGLLFLDTETTGLAGGTGTYAFLVGAAFIENDSFVLVQHFMRDFDEESALLAALDPLLERATGIVTFNGGGFDLPLLETRFVLARRRWPATLAHVDLLRPARRVWSAHFDDCRLPTLERQVLGLVRENDVPGYLIPAIYFDFLRSRRAAPLSRVFEHNRDDVLSLAVLLGWFARALTADADLGPGELAGVGHLWQRCDPGRAAVYYERALEAGLAGEEGHRVRLRLARWQKQQARWSEACALWREASAARVFDVTPWEELAKYHEHRQRDFTTALRIVRDALTRAHASGAPAPALDALVYRLTRLERRTRRTVSAPV
jgi:uncharacterized protein YprB with RNaseH-like and TPR domain